MVAAVTRLRPTGTEEAGRIMLPCLAFADALAHRAALLSLSVSAIPSRTLPCGLAAPRRGVAERLPPRPPRLPVHARHGRPSGGSHQRQPSHGQPAPAPHRPAHHQPPATTADHQPPRTAKGRGWVRHARPRPLDPAQSSNFTELTKKIPSTRRRQPQPGACDRPGPATGAGRPLAGRPPEGGSSA